MAKENNAQNKDEIVQNKKEEKTEGENLSPDLLIKHPLQNRWTLWFYKNDRTKAWEDNLLQITTFDTVEDFWALYNHIELASKLPVGCDYSVFKEGIQPMWEDARNKSGGRWLINMSRPQRSSDLDNYWLETLFCLIGEAFDEFSDEVCGAVVQIRPKGDKIGIWTSHTDHADANIKIGCKLKERLNIHPQCMIGFQAHTDTQLKLGSSAKYKFQV
ncbi:eukaryotic translation initiation factor 4E-like [Centruroides vittatus]|uniref:eukaryotic translation initiation factor 4E-like n=1 Tax=Centruroides vittatus TaxID=120091 RepID=UPI00350F1607